MDLGLHLEVAGTGSYVPEERIYNSYFTGRPLRVYDEHGNVKKEMQVTEEGIFELTGIKERRRAAENENPSDMGYEAAKIAIERSGISASSLVGIIVATVTELVDFPNAAQKIQKRLGVGECIAYDIGFACAGFPEAVAQANARVLRVPGNYLVIGAEKMTSMIEYEDLNSDLFGDGAGAVVLTPTEDNVGILSTFSGSDPSGDRDKWIFRDLKRMCRMPYGSRVFRHAIRDMMGASVKVKEDLGWVKVDVYVPHQANGRIIDGVKERVESEGSIVFRNVERYGNMSAATCPVALDEAWNGYKESEPVILPGDKTIVVAFGGGTSRSAVAIVRRAA